MNLSVAVTLGAVADSNGSAAAEARDTLRALRAHDTWVALLVPDPAALVDSPFNWVGDQRLDVDAVVVGTGARFRLDYDVLVDDDLGAASDAAAFADALLALRAPEGPWERLGWAELRALLVPLAESVACVDPGAERSDMIHNHLVAPRAPML